MNDAPMSEDFYMPFRRTNKQLQELEDQYREEILEPAIDEFFKFAEELRRLFNWNWDTKGE